MTTFYVPSTHLKEHVQIIWCDSSESHYLGTLGHLQDEPKRLPVLWQQRVPFDEAELSSKLIADQFVDLPDEECLENGAEGDCTEEKAKEPLLLHQNQHANDKDSGRRSHQYHRVRSQDVVQPGHVTGDKR